MSFPAGRRDLVDLLPVSLIYLLDVWACVPNGHRGWKMFRVLQVDETPRGSVLVDRNPVRQSLSTFGLCHPKMGRDHFLDLLVLAQPRTVREPGLLSRAIGE